MARMTIARRLFFVFGLALVLAAAWLAPLDSRATQHAEDGLKRALASFAAARTLNAVISVVQGTEVAVQPVGVGVTFTPGQVLDPLNDLVEQFAALMLTASVAFGVQLALIKFGAFWGVSLVLAAIAIGWTWLQWRHGGAPPWLTRFLLAFLLVRFAMPLVVLGSEAGFALFLEKDYAADQARIEMTRDTLSGLSAPVRAPQADESLVERGRRWWSDTKLDLGAKMEELKDTAERAVESIVRLMVVFLLQTLVVPLLLLWALLRTGRIFAGAAALSPPPSPAPTGPWAAR